MRFLFVWKDISLMVFWVNLICVCVGVSVRSRPAMCMCLHILYVMEFQSWWIWLTSLPGPLIFLMAVILLLQGWRRPFSRQLNALFGNGEQIGERSVLGGWYCPFLASARDRRLIQNSLLLLIRSYYNKWLWSLPEGKNLRIKRWSFMEHQRKTEWILAW